MGAAREPEDRRSAEPLEEDKQPPGEVPGSRRTEHPALTSPVPINNQPPAVVLVDGIVVISELEESDPVVVELVRDADDPENAVRSALHVGARAVRAAGVNLDTDVVAVRFAEMSEEMDQQLDVAVAGLSKAIEDAVSDDGGSIPVILSRHRASLEALLDTTFDPDSKTSVISLMEEMLEEARRSQVEAIAAMVAVDGEDSPLANLRTSLAKDVKEFMKEQLKDVTDEVRTMSERLAVNDAVAPVIAVTTAKGFTFEDVLHARLEAIAAVHGDLAEQTGTEPGVAGTKKGDEVVTLNREDTRGSEVRFVLEAKSRKLGLRKAYEELDAALENRSASAGIVVFSSADEAPTTVPFHYSDNRAIVVLDDADHDDGALRLAYMWARWMARRSISEVDSEDVDLDRINSLIDQARTSLGRVKTIRSNHSKALNAIEQAGSEVTRLSEEVESSLSELLVELGE